MLYRRRHCNQRSASVYYWADSSPQGGRDWFLSKYDHIDDSKIEECFRLHQHLWKTCEQLVERLRPLEQDIEDNGVDALLTSELYDDDELPVLMTSRSQAVHFLRSNVESHTPPPMGIGCRAASLDVKARSLIFSAWLEHGTDAMPSWLSSVVSMTTDLGTESRIVEFEGKHWTDLMPGWCGLDRRLQPDGGLRGNLDFERVQAEWLFDFGVCIPGLLHIISNMTQEVDKQMTYFSTWLDGLRAILMLLSIADHRRRFIAQCVRKSRLPDHTKQSVEAQFSKDLPSIVDWR